MAHKRLGPEKPTGAQVPPSLREKRSSQQWLQEKKATSFPNRSAIEPRRTKMHPEHRTKCSFTCGRNSTCGASCQICTKQGVELVQRDVSGRDKLRVLVQVCGYPIACVCGRQVWKVRKDRGMRAYVTMCVRVVLRGGRGNNPYIRAQACGRKVHHGLHLRLDQGLHKRSRPRRKGGCKIHATSSTQGQKQPLRQKHGPVGS